VDLVPERLARALAEGWHRRAASMEYVPEGGGSHHWKLTGDDGQPHFVTVDDLDDKDWMGDTRGAAGGATLPAADVDAINALAAAAPTIRLLSTQPGQHLTEPITRAGQATRLCGDIAAATIDLLTGPDAGAIALCDAPGCGQLYLRGRPNQQWCNPHCGTRARSRRHADRKTGARGS